MEKRLSTEVGEIPYSVVRERRKSVSLRFHNSELIVAIPRYSLVNIDRLLKDHLNWIVKHYTEIKDSKNLLQDGAILINGVYHQIEYAHKYGHSRVTRLENKVIVESQNKEKGMIALLKFSKLLTEGIVFPIMTAKLAQSGKQVIETKFRRMKKWGYCTSERKIRFNAYLSMMPIEIVDYVVSHEVAHLTEMNHSKRFWRVVESLAPDYKRLRKELKRHTVNDTETLAKIREESLD
ncbi:MAG: DUF45 domain-containing protein [Candidatus Micrarchaeota archaeon]|nr:DUF45 domain-containing protein [Candidatus Micrarchaeota archaeon]